MFSAGCWAVLGGGGCLVVGGCGGWLWWVVVVVLVVLLVVVAMVGGCCIQGLRLDQSSEITMICIANTLVSILRLE